MATLTVTVPAQHVQRVLDAATWQKNGRPPDITLPWVIPATQAEVESWLTNQLEDLVHEYEHEQAVAALPPPAPIT